MEHLQYVRQLVWILGQFLKGHRDNIPLLEVEEIEGRIDSGNVRNGLEQWRPLQASLRQRFANHRTEAFVLNVAATIGRTETVESYEL